MSYLGTWLGASHGSWFGYSSEQPAPEVVPSNVYGSGRYVDDELERIVRDKWDAIEAAQAAETRKVESPPSIAAPEEVMPDAQTAQPHILAGAPDFAIPQAFATDGPQPAVIRRTDYAIPISIAQQEAVRRAKRRRDEEALILMLLDL